MPIPYESSGRTRQKLRTRDALVAATRTLIAEGASPTVEEAASRADISRTTAYRYFPNQRSLLIAAHPETERASLLPSAPPDEPAERLAAVLEELHRIVLETEPQLRMALRLSLDPETDRREITLRRGRAIAWIEEALAPLLDRLTRRELHRLALAIRAASGIESLVWLTDVAGLSGPEAVEVMQWSAQGLLRAALRDHKRAAKGKRR
ncbi:MAG: TetR/AcrR family transcriptional regulator [bacterium]